LTSNPIVMTQVQNASPRGSLPHQRKRSLVMLLNVTEN
jgi:hypothetical protein